MIFDIIHAILGLAFALFIPGYLVALIFFKEFGTLEKIALGIILSICIDIIIGLFLGYNETMKNLTGGITAINLWIYLLVLSGILFSVYMFQRYRTEGDTDKIGTDKTDEKEPIDEAGVELKNSLEKKATKRKKLLKN